MLTAGVLVLSGLAGVGAATVLPAATAQAADGPAWTCSTYGYLFQNPSSGVNQIYQVDLVSGEATQIGTTEDGVNAVGYNPTDNYMYANDPTLDSIVQIASDGTETAVTTPSGVDVSVLNVGDFDSDGHYWATRSASGTVTWYEIDYASGSDTYGQLIASGTIADNETGADWAYVDGAFYSIESDTNHLIKFDTATGEQTDLGALAGVSTSGAYGAAYADAEGNVYFSNNDSGVIYRVDPTAVTAITLSNGPESSGNDGARCATAPIPTITVTKTVDGRAATDDQFTVGLDQDSTELTSATTSGTDTTASTTDWPVSEGTTYTITDAMADGSTDTLAAYAPAIVCTDTTTGDTLDTGGSTGAWTFTVPGQDAYTCAVTNTANEPAVSIVKHAGDPVDVNEDGLTDTGDTIQYTFTVTNTGNTSLSDVSVTDAKAGSVTCPESTLAAGDSETCTADSVYTVTDSDVSNGSVDNTATASATPPGAPSFDSPPSSTHTTTTEPDPALTVVKTANVKDLTEAGQKITYSFKVTNTGNVTITDPTVTDSDFSGTGTLSAIECPEDSLAPAASETCTATYTVTQADVDSGKLTNTATATGTPPDGETPPVSPPSTSVVPNDPSPSLAVVKTADVTTLTHAGQKVTYTFKVTNTGNVTVNSPKVTDSDFSGTGTLSAIECPSSGKVLSPGEVENCTATYTVTTADVSSGHLSNTATVSGQTPGGDPVGSKPSTVTIKTAAAGLAFTGSEPFLPMMLGAGLLLAGLLAVAVTMMIRRRRNAGTVGPDLATGIEDLF